MTEKQMSSPASRQVITAQIDNIGIPMWCFSLKVREYQGCSHSPFAKGVAVGLKGAERVTDPALECILARS